MKRLLVTIFCGAAMLAVLEPTNSKNSPSHLFQARAAEDDSEHRCSTQSAKGHYTQSLTGKMSPFGDVSAVGTAYLDGAGGFSGTVTAVAAVGGISQTATTNIVGTYTLNSDCSGTFSITLLGLHLTASGVVVVGNDGNSAQALITSPSSAEVTGALQRQ